jgi:hypothetical protein
MQPKLAALCAFRSSLAERTAIQFAGALIFVALIASPALQAQKQQPPEVPIAPVPSQIAAAKKVFLGNASGDHDVRIAKYIGGPDGIYNQFYADIKNGGKLELVSAPADADIVLQVTIGTFPLVAGYAGVRLAIIDPKTNILLWNISEPIDPAFLARTARKNMAESLQRLADDLQALAPGK